MSRPALAVVLAALATALPASAASPAKMLRAEVGPGFAISLMNQDGTAVRHLDPGDYIVNVDDKGTLHNFHLLGPGVNMATDVERVETATWTVSFQNGKTYSFQCDAHPTIMKGSFGVGDAPRSPIVPRLKGKVTSRSIALTNAAGVRVRGLFAQQYRIAVTDTSKTQNFHLVGPGVNRKTGVAARVSPVWTLTLRPGKYTYKSDRSRRLRGTFTVKSAPPPA